MRRNEILAINGEEHAWRIEGASKGGPSGPPPEPSAGGAWIDAWYVSESRNLVAVKGGCASRR